MLISVNENIPRPIYLQIVAQIKNNIRRGDLRPGDELPSVRELAESLGINLHTVHHAYKKLRDQGILHLRLGQRAKVAALRDEPADRETVEEALAGNINELVTEAFHLGLSRADFHTLVDEVLDARQEGGYSR